ncbi:MAG: hypothetical protein GC150_17355 [Rhizobiales bacterium]|nr:hypothetical protein [Hyphomicrobiales bacterium]
MNVTFRRLLLASTAATIIGYGGNAAAQSSIAVATGVLTIAAGLEAYTAANSQLSDGTTVDATVATVGTLTVDVTDAAAVTVGQTMLNNSVSALARLNQTTQTVNVQSPLPADGALTGAIVATTTTASTFAGVAMLNMQNALDTAQVTANITSAPISLTVAALGMTGDAIAAANQIVADVLVNDAVNSLTATGTAGGNLAVPAAIASVQTATQTAAINAEASIAGATTGVAIDLSALTAAFTGNAVVENNAVAARVGVNTAQNELVAGSATSTANGIGLAIGLDPSLATAAGVASFVADYGVANAQVASGIGADANILAGIMTITLPVAQDVTGTASVAGNTILADAGVNTATNRAIVNTAGLLTASVGVGSAQSLTDDTNVFNANVTTATLTIKGGQFDNASEAFIQGNTVAARFAGNDATNVLGLTNTASLVNSQAAIVGFQVNTDVTATATVGTATLEIDVNAAASDGRALQVTGNTVEASGVLNRQTNLMVVSGGPAFGAAGQAASQLVSSQQQTNNGSVTSTVTSATMAVTSGSGPTASVFAANNTIRASAMGNVSSNTISNTARSFSLGR